MRKKVAREKKNAELKNMIFGRVRFFLPQTISSLKVDRTGLGGGKISRLQRSLVTDLRSNFSLMKLI